MCKKTAATMLKNFIFFIVTVLYASINNVSSNMLSKHDSNLMETSSVKLQDGLFEYVRFSCSSKSLTGPVPSYTPEYKWIYYTHSSSVYVQVFQGISLSYNSTYFNTSLTIVSYNPGYYECQYTFDGREFYNDFQVYVYKNIPGVDLNEDCIISSACYALNSQCENSTCDDSDAPCIGTCQCVAPYDINFNGLDTTPACLTHESAGSSCNVDEECAVENSEVEYGCKDNLCGVVIDDDDASAANNLSSGAIAWIVFGTLVGSALIGGLR